MGDRVGVGDVDGAPGAEAAVELVRHVDRADELALVAAEALVLVHVAGLAQHLHPEAVAVSLDPLHLRPGLELDARVVGRLRHARRADAARAVEGREDLVEPHHHPADRGKALDEQHLVALLAQVERRLQAGDAAADHQGVVALANGGHGGYLRTSLQHRAARVADPDLERHLARQRVRRAAVAGIVGAEGHLDHVQQALVRLDPGVQDAFGRFLDRHADRGVVVGRAHDQVDLLQDPLLVGHVVVGERAARRLHDPHPLARGLGGQDPVVLGVRDLRVADELLRALRGVEHLHEPRPVDGQRVVDGLSPAAVAGEGLEVLLVGLLGEGSGHPVGDVEPRPGRRSVDAGVLPVHETLPAHRAQVRELQVGPGLDPLGDVLRVVGGRVLDELLPLGVHDPHPAVVEVDVVLLVHEPHRVGRVGVGVAQDRGPGTRRCRGRPSGRGEGWPGRSPP